MFQHIIEKLQVTFELIYKPSTISVFFSSDSLWAGLFIGMLWGFVLQKAQLGKYSVVARLFMLQEFTVFRIGAPLIASTMVLLYFFVDIGIINSLVVPRTIIFSQILGGLIMGAGIAIAGYCPGTSVAALGEGALDALFFMSGMFCASALFAEIYPFVDKVLFSIGDYRSLTFPELMGISHWFLIIPFVFMVILFDIGITFWDWFLYLIFLPIRYSRKTLDEFEHYLYDLIEALKRLVTLYFIAARKVNAVFNRLSTDPDYTMSLFIQDVLAYIKAFAHNPAKVIKELFDEAEKT